MHILVIPSWYPTEKNPLNGIFFLEQALALQKAGHRVRVLTVPSFISFDEIKNIRKVTDFQCHQTISDYKGLKTYQYLPLFWVPGKLLDMKSIVRRHLFNKLFSVYLKTEGKPDIIHAHSIFHAGALSVNLLKKYDIPIVLTEHSTAFLRGLINSSRKKIVKKIIHRFDQIIAVGPALSDKLLEYDPHITIKLIGNMVDHEFFTLSSVVLSQKPFVFCAVAILTRKKNIGLLLRAFARTFQGKDVLLRIGGDGEDRNALETMAHELGIAKQVEFLGALSRNQVKDLIQHSHALVSSSDVETFGVNLIEAMSCGRPVVATRSGGPEMFVNKANGILVPTNDVDALGDAMASMFRDYAVYDPSLIRNNCIKEFSAPAIVRKLEEVYAQAMDRRRAKV